MKKEDAMRCTRGFAALAAIGALSCAALPERLEGPNYPATGAPFIAPGVTQAEGPGELPQRDGLVHRLLLVGDAGVPRESEPVLEAVQRWGNAQPDRTTVLYLGDNLYPSGLEADDRERGEAVLQAQLDASTAHKIFVPGNHDWGFPHQGAGRVIEQQAFIQKQGGEFAPPEGCPGPVYRELVPPDPDGSRGLGLILIDIDPWFLDASLRPDCAGSETPQALAKQLGKLLAQHGDQWLVVGAHHPLRTGGPHGGFSRGMLADALTGTIFLIYGSLQDSYEEGYRAIMQPIERALAAAPPLLFAAGHDHNLQVIEGGDHAQLLVVSGAGATERVRGGYVTTIDGTLFAHGHPGFMALDIVRTPDGERAFLSVIETGTAAPVFQLEVSHR